MLRVVLLIVAAPAAMGFSIPQSIPTRRATVAQSLQMATQKAPEPKPGFEVFPLYTPLLLACPAMFCSCVRV